MRNYAADQVWVQVKSDKLTVFKLFVLKLFTLKYSINPVNEKTEITSFPCIICPMYLPYRKHICIDVNVDAWSVRWTQDEKHKIWDK
jgi:hypothetical protein